MTYILSYIRSIKIYKSFLKIWNLIIDGNVNDWYHMSIGYFVEK